MMKTFHGNQTPKSPAPTLRDRDASFSSYLDDSTSELSIFDAHRYFNEVTQVINYNDYYNQKVSNSNSRVSPMVNVDDDIEHNPEQPGDTITISDTSRYSSASSSVDGYANIRNYRRRFSLQHTDTTTTPTASSEASRKSQACLLSHDPPATATTGAVSVSMRNPPPSHHHHPLDDLNKKIRASLSKPILLLRRRCPCSGKKSVQVKEQTPEPKIPMPPTTTRTLPPLTTPQHLHPSNNQIARDSLNLDSNPKTPTDKFTMDPETHNKIPNPIITGPKKCVDQIRADEGQRSHSQEPAISQLQQVIAASASAVRLRPFGDGFTFPLLSPHSSTSTSPVIKELQVVNEDDPTRDSLEVFRPPDTQHASVSHKPIERGSKSSRINDDDAASDASSDLFEIESFSLQTTTPTHPVVIDQRRDESLDEASNLDAKPLAKATATITECYDSAEGYETASVANFFAGETSGGAFIRGGAREAPPAEKWKRKGNGLFGCRCEKAVSVRPQPVKCVAAVAAAGNGGATVCHCFNGKEWKLSNVVDSTRVD